MPINFAAIQQAQLDQAEAEFLAERSKGPTVGDYGRALGVGVADIPTSVGEGLSLLGVEKVGGAVRGFGEGIQESLVAGMTPGGRRAATAPILESETPIATTALKLAQTIPGVAAMAVPGALAVRGLGIIGKAGGIAKLTPKVLETGATLPTKLATGLGFGVSEGVYSGLSNAAQTRSELMNQDIEALEQNPLYQKHLDAIDPSLADTDRQQLAREAASREAEMDVFVKTTLTTGAISAVGGGGVFGALARPTGGVGKEALKGAVAEAATEAPQSVLEAIHQNVALNRPTTQGALTAGVEGGILGGILGGGIGGINAAFTVPGTTQADIDANAPPVPGVAPPGVPPAAPPSDEAFPPVIQTAPTVPTVLPAAARPVARPAPFVRTEPEIDILDEFLKTQANKVERTKAERVAIKNLRASVKSSQVFPTIGEVSALFPEVNPETLPAILGTPATDPATPADLPRSADSTKLPAGLRGRTWDEIQAVLATAAYQPATMRKIDAELERQGLSSATQAYNRLQETANVDQSPPSVSAAVTAPEVVEPPVTDSRAAGVAPNAVASEAQEAGQVDIPAYVAAPHHAQYQDLLAKAAAAGVSEGAAERSLLVRYDSTDGFDIDAISGDFQALIEPQPETGPPKRGRPTKEKQAERAAGRTPQQGTISDPDPDIQENARDIVADRTKLARLREMATAENVNPLAQRLMKAVNELLTSAGTPAPPSAVLQETSSRPDAFGPDYLSEDEDITTWQQMLAELRAVGVERDDAKAILKDHYSPFTGFDFLRFAQTLQARMAVFSRGETQGARHAFKPVDAVVQRGLSPRALAHKVAETQAVVDGVFKTWKRPPFGGVEVHETIGSLPQNLRMEIFSQGALDVRGVYDTETKTVHLIASNLATPEEAQFVLFHEVLGHFGLRGVLGADLGATMRELYKQNRSLRFAANALMKEFGYDLETAIEEALADMAGRNLPIKGLAAFISKLQMALRAVGLDSVADWMEGRTNAEVMHVLAQAKLFVTEGKGAPHIYTPETSKLLYSYAGPRATQANMNGLRAAVEFEALGLSKEQIRATTGWFEGLDKRWKFEISDTGAALASGFDNAQTIGEVLTHPTLFANYPTLRDVPFRWQDLPLDDQAKVTNYGRIIINSRLDDATALSAVLHELQHVIQAAEGFARGGTATTPEVVGAAAKAGGTPEALFEVYQHLAGEIEARDTQARALMTDEERALNEPYTSEALTRAPIVRFGGGAAESRGPAGFRYQIEDAISEKAPGKATSASWSSLLKSWAKQGKLSENELKWSDVLEWLGVGAGEVSKFEVLEFLARGGVQVEEKVYEEGGGLPPAGQLEFEELNSRRATEALSRTELARFLDLSDRRLPEPPHSTYQLPGGTNYRVVLLKVPVKGAGHSEFRSSGVRSGRSYPTRAEAQKLVDIKNSYVRNLEAETALEDWRVQEDENGFYARKFVKPPASVSVFMQGHFLGEKNVVAHVRTNDRIDVAGKKVLFLEELQADLPAEIRELEAKIAETVVEDQYKNIEEQREAYGRRLEMLKKITPFPKTEAWTALLLKRMLIYASENGYDKIAWTTGEQQIDRYSTELRQRVDKIAWSEPTASNDFKTRKIITAYKGGKTVFHARISIATKRFIDGPAEGKTVEEVFGKAIAAKIVESKEDELKGEGLAIGGVGMKGYYDTMLPNIANGVLKKLGGGRVGSVELPKPFDLTKGLRHKGGETTTQPGFDVPPGPIHPTLFSRAGQDSAQQMGDQIGEFYNFSAPFQRSFRKLASFGSKSSAARVTRLALSKSIISPYHLATSKKADGTLRSHGFSNLFQNVLRQKQSFSDYINSTLWEPIQKTWVQGQGLGKPPPEFEAAARALFDHNDAEVPTAEFFGNPQHAVNLDPKARELYNQIREVIKRGLMAEFTAKATRMREVIDDPRIYAEALQELHVLTQQRIDNGFIPNRRHGEYAIGAYRAGELMQWYTFESTGEAKAAAVELRALFKGSDITLDIDTVGNGEPLTVERAAGDRYSTSSYWDFLEKAREAGVELLPEQKGRLAKLMIHSESMLQNKIQRRKGVPGYSKDLMRTIGEFVTTTGFSVAETQMSARTTSAMNEKFFLNDTEKAELLALQNREDFKPLAAVSESKAYEALTQEPDLMKRFEALTAYSRMKYLEVAGGQFWAQDDADKGFYRDRSNELIAFLKSPKGGGVSGALRTIAALHFLGGSAASAIVNLSSLPMFAAPYLHQFIGVRAYPLLTKHFKNFSTNPALRDLSRLAAALDPQQRGSGQAAKDWKSLEPLGEELLTAVQRAAEEGIISDSQIHEMFGFARGGLLAHSSAVRKGISAWMAPFRFTEQANRFSTFMAAFEAGQKGISDGTGGTKALTGAALYDFARDAVDQTQAIYGPINRQPWARMPIGHALFTFRAFPLMMGELLLRLPAPQRTLALGSLVLAAGINGIPFADDLRDIIDTIAQRVFGTPLNTRRLMTNMVAQASEAAVGTDLSRLIMNGGLDALTGASISGRIGFGNLIPGTRIGAAGEDFFQRTMADIAGPVGTEIGNFAKAFQGQPEALLPSAARNVGKAVEAARYGKLTDYKGQTLINDVTPMETFMQGLGFTSGRLSEAYETQRGGFQEQAYVEEVKNGFLNDIRTAVAHDDMEALADVREEITAWNEMHPRWPIILRPSNLRSTLKLAGRPLTERVFKALPREWRAQNLNQLN